MACKFEHVFLTLGISLALFLATSTEGWVKPRGVGGAVSCKCTCSSGNLQQTKLFSLQTTLADCGTYNNTLCTITNSKGAYVTTGSLSGCNRPPLLTTGPNTGVTGINRNGQGVSINPRR
jgi:hypothetical protein